MSIKVDPPPQLKIPDQFFNDDELRGFFEQQRNILTQLWNRSGGSGDTIFRTQIRDLFPRQAISDFTTSSFELVSTDVDFTTTGNQIVIATSNITVSLNSYPEEKEEVFIKRATTLGTVIIDPVVKNIDGDSTYNITLNYADIHCVYSAVDDEWFIL